MEPIINNNAPKSLFGRLKSYFKSLAPWKKFLLYFVACYFLLIFLDNFTFSFGSFGYLRFFERITELQLTYQSGGFIISFPYPTLLGREILNLSFILIFFGITVIIRLIKNKNYKRFDLIVAAIIIFLISSFYLLYVISSPLPLKQKCVLRPSFFMGDAKYACFEQLAIEQKNPLFCENTGSTENKDWCFLNLAKTSKNMLFCAQISLNAPYFHDGVRSDCVYELIPDGSDKTKCLVFNNETFKDEGLYDTCLSKIENETDEGVDINWCANYLTNNFKNRCIMDVAERVGEIKKCDLIIDISYRQLCYYMVVEKMGINEDTCRDNSSYYNSYYHPDYKHDCINEVGVKKLCELTKPSCGQQKCIENLEYFIRAANRR